MNSEERIEVAKRLRKSALPDEYLYEKVTIAIQDTMGEVQGPVAKVLANLIDPICHLLPADAGGYACDSCYTWFPQMEKKPAYCPACGARVVHDDE